MKATIPLLVLLGLGLPAAAGATESLAATAAAAVAATPLLEVEARGLRTTDVDIPFCGNTCRNIDPHFLSYRVAIAADGAMAGTLTEKELDERAARAAARFFLGTATPEQMATLRALLGEARIGLAQGGCTVRFAEPVPGEAHPTQHGYLLSYTVLWFGRGNRLNFFALPQGAGACEEPLRDLMRHVLLIARDAQRRASP